MANLDYATIAPGFARDLGPWTEPQGQESPGERTDFSSIVYDPAGDQFVAMGGHHSRNVTTTPRLLKPHEGRYWNPVATTPTSEMTPDNSDPELGRWINRNHPWSRHTYQGMVVVGRRLYVMAGQNSHNAVQGRSFTPGDGRPYWFDLQASEAQSKSAYGFSQLRHTGWLMMLAAAPVGARHLLVINNPPSNWLQAWLYDIERDSRVRLTLRCGETGWRSDPSVVYFPPNGKHYVFDVRGRVFEISVDPARPQASTCVQVSDGWPVAPRPVRMDYDPVNWVLGGSLLNGSYMAFDPVTMRWGDFAIAAEAGSAGAPTTSFWAGAFDQKRGVYVALTSAGNCWVVRPPAFKAAARIVPTAFAAKPASAARAGAVGSLSVELDFGAGKVARFAGGDDLGSFVGEHVRQRCLLARDPGFADWRVLFRPDEDGTRDEVIVEYGRAEAGTPANHMQPYTATIRKGDQVLHKVTVPTHWWYARWRWQSAPRKRVRTLQQLVERGWIPSLDEAAVFGRAPYKQVAPAVAPMTMAAHLSRAMGNAGDHPCIGPLTEAQADYALRGNEAIWPTVLAEAESCGTWPMHVRLIDGSLPDVTGLHYRGASPSGAVLHKAPGVAHAEYMSLAISHWYPCANLAWLLTEDPYHLESLQAGVNWRLLWSSWARLHHKLNIVDTSQPRTVGWMLRDQFLLAATTPEKTPRWLQPRATWRRQLDDLRGFMLRFVNSKVRMCSLFRVWFDYRKVASWMTSFINISLAQGVRMGFAEWRPVALWGMGQHIAMSDGKSGWSVQVDTPYFWWPLKTEDTSAARWPVEQDAEFDRHTHASWADACDAYVAKVLPGENRAAWPTIEPRLNGIEAYILHLRAALALAVAIGMPEARPCLATVERQIALKRFTGQARFALSASA